MAMIRIEGFVSRPGLQAQDIAVRGLTLLVLRTLRECSRWAWAFDPCPARAVASLLGDFIQHWTVSSDPYLFLSKWILILVLFGKLRTEEKKTSLK